MFGYVFDALLILLVLALLASPYLPGLLDDRLPWWVRILDLVAALLAARWMLWWWDKSITLGLTAGLAGFVLVIFLSIKYSKKFMKAGPVKMPGDTTAE